MSLTPATTTEWTGPTRFLAPPEPGAQADGSKRYEGVTYAVAPGYRPLQLDLWVPASPASPPLVVWIHGGGWMFGDRRYLPETLRPNQLFEELVAAGLATATIDYRRALEAHFPAPLHDAKAAIRHLRAHADVLGINTSKIGVWGESAGGHLAALVGLTVDPRHRRHGGAIRASDVLARALTDAGVSARLVPVEGAEHIFNGYDDIDGIVGLSVQYLAEALRG
jgi:acetyl esterase/lipase